MTVVACILVATFPTVAVAQRSPLGRPQNVKELNLSPAAQEAVDALGRASVAAASEQGTPTFIVGKLGRLAIQRGRKLDSSELVPHLRPIAAAFRVKVEDLELTKVKNDKLGFSHAIFAQKKNGLPVIGSRLAIHIDRDGEIYAASGNTRDDVNLTNAPKIHREAATMKVVREFGRAADAGNTRLVYMISTRDQSMHIAYEVHVTDLLGEEPFDALVYVDAESGEIVDVHSQVASARIVRTANYTNSIAGTVVRDETSGATGEPVYDTNFDHLGRSLAFMSNALGRNSIDGQGLNADSSTYYRKSVGGSYFPVSNAHWFLELRRAAFGEGIYQNNWATALDIVAHELAHGITQAESGLIYANEAGAINESFSDIFAGSVGNANSAHDTWYLIGENLFSGQSSALRAMNSPTAYGNSKDYYPERHTISAGTVPSDLNDYGHVHRNSGISNLAFYLMCVGGQHPRQSQSSPAGGTIPTTTVGALGMSKASAIFYRANTVYLGPGSQFMDLRQATVQAAQDLYGSGDASTVSIAWDVVGVPTFVNRFPIAVSARAYVGIGQQVLIAGVVVGGGSSSKQLLLRGLGPHLSSVSGRISDPQIELKNSSGTTLLYNDDWSSSPDASTIASLSNSLGAGALVS